MQFQTNTRTHKRPNGTADFIGIVCGYGGVGYCRRTTTSNRDISLSISLSLSVCLYISIKSVQIKAIILYFITCCKCVYFVHTAVYSGRPASSMASRIWWNCAVALSLDCAKQRHEPHQLAIVAGSAANNSRCRCRCRRWWEKGTPWLAQTTSPTRCATKFRFCNFYKCSCSWWAKWHSLPASNAIYRKCYWFDGATLAG